jgi:hypothetical protein
VQVRNVIVQQGVKVQSPTPLPRSIRISNLGNISRQSPHRIGLIAKLLRAWELVGENARFWPPSTVKYSR